jgi:hypothetical protein
MKKLNIFVVVKFGDWNENIIKVFVGENNDDVKEFVVGIFDEDELSFEFEDVNNGCYGWKSDSDEFGGLVLNVNEFVKDMDNIKLSSGINLMLNVK